MSIWAEIWTRPGDPNYGRVIDGVPDTVSGLHAGFNEVGDGNMTLPDSFERFDEILFIDHLSPANCVSSTVKLFDDSDPLTPIFEWIPDTIVPTGSKEDQLVEVTGEEISTIVGYGRVDAFDWDGSDDFVPAQPDWIFGGDNLLGNPGFEESNVTPTQWTLIITATGGTYTLTDGTDTTSAINFDAGASVIEDRLQGDISAITDIIVVAAGSSPRTFIIEAFDPSFGFTLAINTGSLTGGTGTIDETQEGTLSPSPWTRASTLVAGAPKGIGSYARFEVTTDQAHSGTHSLAIDAGPSTATSNRLPGTQQVVSTTPGALYQASVWIFPTSGTDLFRLGIFGVGEEFIAWNASAGVTLTPNTWNQITVSDILLPDDATRIIFRVACTNVGPSNPSLFFVDDGVFFEGLPPTTPGEILRLLYEQMIDATLYSTIFWDDGSGTDTPYLTLDFSDALDSGGVAWFESEISMRVWMRMTLRHVLDTLASDYGIEWRVVPNDVEAGTYLLQAYNPGTMKVDHTAAASPAIQGGSQDVRRQIVRMLPAGTDMMVEGLGRLTGRDSDSTLIGSLGRIASSRIDRELPELVSVAQAAFEDRTNSLIEGLSLPYTLIDPQDIPLVDYSLGDLLPIHDPPEVDFDARLVDVTGSFTPESEEWEVVFIPATAQGS